MNNITYFDSSVLLSILFTDRHSEQALNFWESSDIKLSSNLISFETAVVIKRAAEKMPIKVKDTWLKSANKWIEQALSCLLLHDINLRILLCIKEDKFIHQCRTLDAIHLATLKVFNQEGADNIKLATFDERMAEVAEKVGVSLA